MARKTSSYQKSEVSDGLRFEVEGAEKRLSIFRTLLVAVPLPGIVWGMYKTGFVFILCALISYAVWRAFSRSMQNSVNDRSMRWS